MLLARSSLFALVLLLAGCASLPDRGTAAPTSYMTRAEAGRITSLWYSEDPEQHSYSDVAATGSMRPDFDANAVLLLEKVRAGDEHTGDIVVWERPGSAGIDDAFRNDPAFILWKSMAKDFRAVHRIRDVRHDGLFVSGDNNLFPDGWVRYEWVQWRVAGILFTKPSTPPPQ